MNKRAFLRTSLGGSLALLFGEKAWAAWSAVPPRELAQDDRFWATIRSQYRLTDEYINLESGYYSMQSQPVLEAFINRVRTSNFEHSRYMRTRQTADKQAVKGRLAELAGCAPEELIITRNTTESLDTVISGIEWQPGDEAVMSVHDYGAMLDQFRLMERRRGIVRRTVTVPLDPRSDDEVVRVYEEAITPRTKLLMVCHMINITGHILPVAKIADMAHARGVPVLVDGAHAFAQLDFRVPDLHADYYGASLHKWLGVPLGAGILYVKRERIAGLWPMFAEGANVPDDDIRKLNHTGTHPVHTDLAINDAIDFHLGIGIQRKEARLRWLQRYWTDRVRGTPGITLNTPSDPARHCAIANVSVTGITPRDLAQRLFERHRIWTVGINTPGAQGVRVTPHMFTTTAELDALVRALKSMTA